MVAARPPETTAADDDSEDTTPRPAWVVALDWGSLVVIVIVLTLLLKTFLAQPFYIPSGSMENQLEVGDRIVVSKLSYRLHGIHRGDIVVFDEPPTLRAGRELDNGDDDVLPVRVVRAVLEGLNVVRPKQTEYVKRVIGLPGDTVVAREGSVYVNGRLLVEPYLQAGTRTSLLEDPVTVPDDHLFVLGDNRGGSHDSRFFGPIAVDDVVGRVVVRIWPLTDISWL